MATLHSEGLNEDEKNKHLEEDLAKSAENLDWTEVQGGRFWKSITEEQLLMGSLSKKGKPRKWQTGKVNKT